MRKSRELSAFRVQRERVMAGSNELINQLEEQMGYFRVAQEFREIAADQTPGPGHDFARGWAKAALKLMGNDTE